MTPESRPRSNLFRGASPKHFLTWSATAANHKIQKLSKHLAQNVSKLQVRVDKVLHPPVPNGNVNNQSQASTPSLGTTAARTLPSSSRNVQDAQDHQHLLSVNNVHMAVVHNLSVSRGQKLMRDGDQFPKVDPSAPAQTSPDPDDSWKTFSCSRSRQKFDFEMERKKIAQSLGEGLDIFELTPLATTGSDGGSDDATTGNGRQTLNDSSGSSHDTSVSSGTSFGASTLPARSPHWSVPVNKSKSKMISLTRWVLMGFRSRASSLTSTGDTIPLPDEHDNELGAHARSLIPLSQGKDGGDIPAQESIHPDESELSVRIMEEEPELRLASWFHAGIPRYGDPDWRIPVGHTLRWQETGLIELELSGLQGNCTGSAQEWSLGFVHRAGVVEPFRLLCSLPPRPTGIPTHWNCSLPHHPTEPRL